ncbi:hypothetical protein Godav_003826, partial [Gossypium davidsonii]|nr:hypothetical protein [Gossypium davidsonii]
MANLHNVGTFNADMRFKAGYLNELERMLEKVLPHAMLKAKPNLESRIRTLKRDLAIVYDMLSGKDNSNFATDILEEIDVEDVAIIKNLEEGKNYHGCKYNVSLDEMDVSTTQLQPENILNVGLELSSSIAFEMLIQRKLEMFIQESAQKLYLALYEVEGLTEDDPYRVLSKIPDHPMQMLAFFSLISSVRLEW